MFYPFPCLKSSVSNILNFVPVFKGIYYLDSLTLYFFTTHVHFTSVNRIFISLNFDIIICLLSYQLIWEAIPDLWPFSNMYLVFSCFSAIGFFVILVRLKDVKEVISHLSVSVSWQYLHESVRGIWVFTWLSGAGLGERCGDGVCYEWLNVYKGKEWKGVTECLLLWSLICLKNSWCVRPTMSDINLKRYIKNNEVTHLIFI